MINPEKVYKWGQAVLVTGAIAGGLVTMTGKAVSKVNSTMANAENVPSLTIRVGRLEKQSRFMVRGMEKLTKMRYPKEEEDRE